jgi:hypothetical protein
MTTIKIPIVILSYDSGFGVSLSTHETVEQAEAAAAVIARSYWPDRHDLSAPEDHSGLPDDEVRRAYFRPDEPDSYEIEEHLAEISLERVKDLIRATEIETSTK